MTDICKAAVRQSQRKALNGASTTSRKLRILDLFAGIGGFSIGLERTGGFETVAFCEREPFCQKVLAKHWPDVPIYDDVRTLPDDADRLGRIDIVTGGFPCQPFSHAGARKGVDDDRHLWPSMLAVIEACRPTWVIGENVNGLVSMAFDRGPAEVESRTGGRTPNGIDHESVCVREESMLLASILDDLGSIGYAVQPFVIPACAVDAPHRRDRVWIVGHADHDREPVGTVNGKASELRSMADASERRRSGQGSGEIQQPRRAETICTGEAISDTNGEHGGNERTFIEGNAGGQHANDALPSCEAMADTPGQFCNGRKHSQPAGAGGEPEPVSDADHVDAQGRQANGRAHSQGHGAQPAERPVGLPDRERTRETRGQFESGLGGISHGFSHWPHEPGDVPRVATGIPNRVDRLKALGNAVVPRIPEAIGHAILQAEKET